MKKILLPCVLIGLYACDDGDLQIEEVDFAASNIASCPGLDDLTNTTFFFKIDEDEALLLNLAPGLLKNETSVPGTLASTIPTPSSLTYRFFTDNVTSAYFCDAIPPLEPTVLKENEATAGNINIDTKVDNLTADTKDYAHTITMDNLSLVNDLGEQLTDLSTLVYGDFISKPKNSARLDVPFSNYTAVAMAECTPGPIAENQRLYKINADEFIALDVPIVENLFENKATLEGEPRTLSLADRELFRYTVLDKKVDADIPCATIFGEDVQSWVMTTSSGTLKVETVASTPDTNGSITYTHTITLENSVLTLKGDGADIKDVNLPAIPSFVFGTYTTTSVQ
ncbi:MAG: hypothetical protein WBG48_11755 [Pricia sp.]